MGGIIIIMVILIFCLLLADLSNVYVVFMIVSIVWMVMIGFIDDYIKVFCKNKEGLCGIFKVLGQIGLGLLIVLMMIYSEDIVVCLEVEEVVELGYIEMVGDMIYVFVDLVFIGLVEKGDYKVNLINVFFLKGNCLDYVWLMLIQEFFVLCWVWLLFVLLVIFVVIVVFNVVNFIDGLDGLVMGVLGIIGVLFGIFVYVLGNVIVVNYLNILYLLGIGELVIFVACFVGVILGFLWYNFFFVQIFMGDIGSLILGGIIVVMAIIFCKELLIFLLCGIFLVENLLVVL